MSDYLKAVQERVVIYDGAMGTAVQAYNLPLDEFWGKDGYNDILVLSRPDIVKEIHAAYFDAGADVVETNTFSSTRIVMAEYDMGDQVHEVNMVAAQAGARSRIELSNNGRKRFVAGSMGPTTKLPSLGHIGFDDMAAAYTEQADGLIEGGVDVLLLETCQDILQAKAGLVGIFDALKKTGKNIPVQVQVTLEATGLMLLGTEIGAALTVAGDVRRGRHRHELRHRPEGDERRRALSGREFAAARLRAAECRIAAECRRPRGLRSAAAGTRRLPQAVHHRVRRAHRRRMLRHELRAHQSRRGYLRQSRASEARRETGRRRGQRVLHGAARPRSQAAHRGRGDEHHHARRALQEHGARQDYDGILTLAKKLVNEGSHMLDLCCAIVGEDEKAYISNILEKIATRVPAPITVDSTEADVIEEALKRIPGKAIINSINLEDGEKRTSKVLPMAKRYGAAVIALTIDEDGMALTWQKKLAIAQRIFDLAVEQVRHSPLRPDFRRAHAAHLDRPGRLSHRRHRDAERRAGHQAGAARGEDHPRRQQHLVRAECVFAARAE